MSLILNIETSTDVCSVAISRKSTVLCEKSISQGHSHSRIITTLVAQCMKEASLGMGDIRAVAVSDGPGSYTGLRVGASTAKGLCYALGLPLIAVSTLKSLAAKYVRVNEERYILPMIDARRMEVYAALYNQRLECLMEPFNMIITENTYKDLTRTYHPLVICGNGAPKCERQFGQIRGVSYHHDACKASDMCQIAYTKYQQKQFEDVAYYSPFYYKSPNITKSQKKLV